VGTRPYRQKVRAEAAEETRRRILDAVHQRLRDAPTEPVSIERVAAMAGVSRSTIYLVFGTRAGLFDALGEDIRRTGGFDRAVELDQLADGDVRPALLDSIRASVPVFAAHRAVLRALYAMAALDTDAVGGAVDRMGRGRAESLAEYAARLADLGQLRPGLAVADATHLLWAITSFETFDQLHTGRSLSAGAVADLMVAMAEHSVLRADG
jgi:AcrR family transcriptional regulator